MPICVIARRLILLLGCALTAHALPSLSDLGENVLTGNISHPKYAQPDGKVGSIPPQPVFGGSYHYYRGFIHEMAGWTVMRRQPGRRGRISTGKSKEKKRQDSGEYQSND
jgi:hypothetical protein